MAMVIILVQIVDIMAMSSWDTQGCRDKDCDGDYHDKFDDIYIMMQCLSRKMSTFLKGLSVCL